MRHELLSALSHCARCAAAAGISCLFLWGATHPARAAVTVDGDVLLVDPMTGNVYADNPFTSQNEGIPTNGNTIEQNVAFGQQVTFEGRRADLNTPPTPGDPTDDTNVNFHIIVGRTGPGYLEIAGGTGGTDLRDEDLIIGDSAVINNVLRRGSGQVYIRGLGTLYNNNPLIQPWFPPPYDPENPTSPSKVPRPTDVGFDLYVGRTGFTGLLDISQGGRAEIQDAVIVGQSSDTEGTINIDGAGSLLFSGGFMAAQGAGSDEIHYLILGQFGDGTMNITNGGQAVTSGPLLEMGGTSVGAVLGGEQFQLNQVPEAGGVGIAYVDGNASRWSIGGTLQIGGYHNSRNDDDTVDLDGNNATYPPNVGSGRLTISNGALVDVVSPPLSQGANAPEELDILIGQAGEIVLNGGRLELLGVIETDENGENPEQQVLRGRVINDGKISGSGNITSLQFRNRVLGEVFVDPGQSLVIRSIGEYTETDNFPLPGEQEYPLSNYGLIQVIGSDVARAEIEFERALVTNPSGNNLTRPFLNLPIPIGEGSQNGRTGGEIVAQDAILRFPDIINRHKVSFAGGDNLVAGNFTNEGTVFVGGNGTTVTFIDEFIDGGGVLDIGPNVSLVMFLDDVTLSGAGALNTTFGGRPDVQAVSHLSAAESFFLAGTLNASLFTSPGVPQFTPVPGDQFEIISAANGLFGDFSTVNLPGCINGTVCFVGFPDYTLDAYFIRAYSIAGALGADFDGNGIVDDVDLQIWRQNVGGPGPAGDANGDGIVNGLDFIVWQMQVGGPGMPVPGGGGGGLVNGTVPEPAGGVLLALGGMLALVARRRSRGRVA